MCSAMCFTKFSENAEKIYIKILFSVASLEITKPAVSAVAFETCMVSFCMHGWHSLNRLTKASNICSIAAENLRKLMIRSFWFHNPKRIKKHLFLKVQSLLTLGGLRSKESPKFWPSNVLYVFCAAMWGRFSVLLMKVKIINLLLIKFTIPVNSKF